MVKFALYADFVRSSVFRYSITQSFFPRIGITSFHCETESANLLVVGLYLHFIVC